MLAARQHRIAVSRVKVGDVEIDVRADLALLGHGYEGPEDGGKDPAARETREDVYAHFGGGALERLAAEEEAGQSPGGGAVTVVEDEDEPG